MTPMSRFLTACVMSLAVGGEFAAHAATLPQLPQKQVNTTMPTVNGSTLNATCATLQAQLNAAAALNVNLTHRIILATGTTCTGAYMLPSHTGGTGWILLTGPNLASLPPPGTRVSLSDAALMPKIQYGQSADNATISAASGAQRYRIIGIEFLQNDAFSPNYNFIIMGRTNGTGFNTGYLIVDRSILRDIGAVKKTIRAVYASADVGNVALVDSYCAGIARVGQEAQCFSMEMNPGPILVQNNFLEAAGENTMLCGGDDPRSAAEVPSDATFRLNHYSVNSAWYAQAGGYVVKSLFELKCGVRVLVEGNTFENMAWDGGGNAFRLTVRNVNGPGTNADVSDLTVRYNLVRNVTNFINSFGADDQGGPRITKHSKRWYIHNNLIYGLGFKCGGGATCGALLSIQPGGGSCTDPGAGGTCKIEDLTFQHNTVDDIQSWAVNVAQAGQIDLDFKDNLINANNKYGLFGQYPLVFGTNLLNAAWAGPTGTMTNNSIAAIGNGDNSANYPQGTNTYPSSYTNFQWTNRAARDYTLQAGSPANNAASDGTDQGVNFSAYNAARAGGSGGSADLVPPAAPQGVFIRLN